MRLLRSLAVLGTALPTVAARACTVCDSPNGHQLRAGLFNGHFLHTLGIVAAPVPVFVLAVLLLHRIMPDLSDSALEPCAAMELATGFGSAEPVL